MTFFSSPLSIVRKKKRKKNARLMLRKGEKEKKGPISTQVTQISPLMRNILSDFISLPYLRRRRGRRGDGRGVMERGGRWKREGGGGGVPGLVRSNRVRAASSWDLVILWRCHSCMRASGEKEGLRRI